jgi:class 3 adenylate cyclase/predicted ATPase
MPVVVARRSAYNASTFFSGKAVNSEQIERRLMAILMADVAGYSRLMGADDEGTFAQLNTHHSELIEPKIKEHRGRIARTTGDGLLALFASAVDALRCAVEIQRAMAERNLGVSPDKRLEFRMGINVGDIIEAASIHGEGVNVAARLEALADVGGICVSDRVQEDVHGTLDRLGIAFEDAGQHHLKNIARPMRVYRVRLHKTAHAQQQALSTPEHVAVEPTAQRETIQQRRTIRWWVGRAAPLATLDGMAQRMLAGERQLVFITGEPGIGKTTFIEMAIERLSRLGAEALYGHCAERFGTDEAFHPLIDALETRCRGPGGSAVLETIRARAPTWLLQMPSFREETDAAAFQNEVFGATRERMLREFCDLLEVSSVDRPVAVVLEDLHWSDFATLDVLSRFARGDRKASVLVLASYRPADTIIGGHPVRRLHQDLGIHGRCRELRLDRLSRGEVEHHLALRFGNEELVSTLVEPLFGRTQGQPLFVASLLDFYINQQVVFEIDGAWRLGRPADISQDVVPNDLINMISHQMDRLTQEERQLLEVASVAGGEFAAALVAAGLGRDELETEQLLDALAGKDRTLVASRAAEWPDGTYSGSYAFHHILYQNVLYQGLTPGRRAQIHRRMGERLRDAYGNRTADIAPMLAMHFEHGRDFPNALRYLSQAAESSAKRLGHEEAANYLTRALGILDHLKAADQYGPRIGLLRQRSWARRSSGDLAGSVQDLKEMIALASAAGQLRAEVNGLLAVSRFCLHADRRLCLQASEEAAAKANAVEDEGFRALVQGSSASINLYLKGWTDADAELCLKAMEVTANAKDHATLIRRDGIEGILECFRARYQECRVSATHGKKLAREVGDIYIFVLFNVMESTALLHLGEWRQLQQETVEALALAEKNANRPARALCRLTLAWLHVEALDFQGANELCEGVEETILEENPFAFFFHRAVLAKAFVGLGDPQRASKQFEDVLRRVEADGTGLDFTIYTQFYHCFAEYCLLVGDIAQARIRALQLHDYAAPAPDRNHLALAYGLLARIAFAAGDWGEARAQLSRALATLDNANLPLAAWRIYLGAAEIYDGLGEIEQAARYRGSFETVMRTLAQNFAAEDPLRASLLAAIEAKPGRSTAKPSPS